MGEKPRKTKEDTEADRDPRSELLIALGAAADISRDLQESLIVEARARRIGAARRVHLSHVLRKMSAPLIARGRRHAGAGHRGRALTGDALRDTRGARHVHALRAISERAPERMSCRRILTAERLFKARRDHRDLHDIVEIGIGDEAEEDLSVFMRGGADTISRITDLAELHIRSARHVDEERGRAIDADIVKEG